MKDANNVLTKEVDIFRQNLEKIEKQLESGKKMKKCEKVEKNSAHNFIKSSPESSQADKSGSEVSKKFISKNNTKFDGDCLRLNGLPFISIPNSRYKIVNSLV